MISEEQLEEYGIVPIALTEEDKDECARCVFQNGGKVGVARCYNTPCTMDERDAPHNVIWMRREDA